MPDVLFTHMSLDHF